MKNEIDIHQILRVFDKIRQHGEQGGDGHILQGVSASTDFDGYTIFLSDAQCSLTVYFHNKYNYEYPSDAALEDFNKRIRAIDKQFEGS